MSQSPQIQARINTVANQLAAGKERAEILAKFAKKWKVSPTSIDRYLKSAKEIAIKLSSKADKAAEDAMISQTVEAAKLGLKSKHERVMILQREVDTCLDELYGTGANNFGEFWGKRTNIKKKLTVMEKVKLRQVINSIQAEISKIQGDYAPTKLANTDKEGNDVIATPSQIVIMQGKAGDVPIMEGE